MGAYAGIARETVEFLTDLSAHNNREWFAENRERYDTFLLEPARELVRVLGARLREIAPGIVADPKVNRSIFRLARDTRFSNNPDPYKTHLALWFWEGAGKRMTRSGFYLEVAPEHVMVGGGMYQFPKEILTTYREEVAGRRGAALDRAVKALTKAGYEIGGDAYVRTPRGCPKGHKRDALLKRKGVVAFWKGEHPEALFGEEALDWIMGHFEAMAPLHAWLDGMLERVDA